jgi:hypothetical protein
MPTIAERRDFRTGGSGDKHEAYQEWGRDASNPEMQRLQGLAGQFGGQYGTALGQQQQSFDAFGRMAAGGGPSMAQSQLAAGMQQANRAAVQASMQARGGNAAGGQLAAMQAATQLGGQAAVQSAQLAQQEQIAAMQAQAGMANQMAGQGLQGQMGMEGLYQGNLGAQYQGDIDYRLGSRGLREQERSGHNQRIRGNIGTGTLGAAGDSSAGVLSDERAKKNVEPANANAIQAANPYANYQNPAAGEAGGIIGGNLGKIIGLAGLLSDERTKRNVRPGNLAASQTVGELNPYTFEYEAGLGDGPGQRVGIMAQDLERVAPQAVMDTPQGKMVNAAQGTGIALAASADQEQRIRGLESALAGASSGGGLAGMSSPADNAMRRIEAMSNGASVASGPRRAQTQDSYSLQGVTGGLAAYSPAKDGYYQGYDGRMG